MIGSHLARGPHGDPLSDGLVFDAVRVRLIEIGEAVKGVSASTLASEPGIPWRQVAGMRDRLAHHYFNTVHATIAGTCERDLQPIREAVERLVEGDSRP